VLGRVLLLLLTAAGVAGALPAAAASIRWSTAGGGPQGGDVVGERLEGLALARARSELVRRVLELPLEGGASVGQWAARALSRDCALREWLRRQPPHGAPRRYAGGVVEVDVRLAADELALKLVALSRGPGGAGGAAAGAEAPIPAAGGAASAALCALLDDRIAGVTVLNRTVDRARALAEMFGEDPRIHVAGAVGDLHGEQYDLVINATSLGLHSEDPLPLDLEGPIHVGAALDLVYSPSETAWVHEARRRGIVAADGREMLVAQGAAAFERWWGRPAPIAAMRQALADATAPAG